MKLERVRTGDWQILAVCTDRGDCPLLEFLAGLEGQLARDGRRMLRLLARVASKGAPRNTQISHQLDSGIWEFIQGRIRVLWFYDQGRMIICSHGFVKKRQRTPADELERARGARRRYLESKIEGDLEIAT